MPTIPFQIEQQQASNWCWAAVAVSVKRYFDSQSQWRQCGVAKVVLSAGRGEDQPAIPASGCCHEPVPEECNQPWYLEDALKRVGRLKGKARNGHLSFAAIGRAIDAGKPVCMRIGWSGGGGHFLVISGYHTDRSGVRQVDFHDPGTGGQHTVEYSSLVANYRGSGKWTHTYPV